MLFASNRLKIQDFFTRTLDSKIISNLNLEARLVGVCEFSMGTKWKLLYRASKDGFAAQNFHSKCDSKPNTLTIIKSSHGNVFGGYTRQTWNATNVNNQNQGYMADKKAFVFSLTNKDNEPVKMKIQKGQEEYAIKCEPGCCFIFGNNDLKISDKSNENMHSFTDLDSSYVHPQYIADRDKARSFLAGSYKFQVVEIEVFQDLLITSASDD
jgi:hypothetical protein